MLKKYYDDKSSQGRIFRKLSNLSLIFQLESSLTITTMIQFNCKWFYI